MNDSNLNSGWKPVNKSGNSAEWDKTDKGFGVSNANKGWKPVNKSGKGFGVSNVDDQIQYFRKNETGTSTPIESKPNTQGKNLNSPVTGSGWKSSYNAPKPNPFKSNEWTIHGVGNDYRDGITLTDTDDIDATGNINSSEKDYDIRACIPPNLGWLSKNLNPAEMKYCWDCIKKSEESINLNNEDHDDRKKLVGNISKSRKLEDTDDIFLNRTLLPLVKSYATTFPMQSLRPTKTNSIPKKGFVLSDWWVNYQKKHEFNPLHDHSGMFSFVIWMKIPTNSKDQQKLQISAGNNELPKSISNFRFSYTNILGQITNYTYEQNPDQEGFLLFFPSELNHQVFPFYDCDEDRISISGNIKAY